MSCATVVASESARLNLASAVVFMALSPTIFEEFKLITSQRGGKPSCLRRYWFGTACNGAAWKVLAKQSARKQNRASMSCCTLCIRSRWFGGSTALVLAAAIVLLLGLSVAPNLHERLHPTAASLHECAVTLIASGSCHHTGTAPLVIAPATAVQFSKILALNSIWVAPPFLGACIFEHAPPAHS